MTDAAPAPRVLISDKLSEDAVRVLEARGISVTFDPSLGKDPEALKAALPGHQGLAIRSATRATAEVIKAAPDLRVIGRAGIGVDNIDIDAATSAGIAVMNTPFGNAVTTAEHAIAMMFALSRQIPQANESTHQGKWEKSRFMGRELYGKTLGLIGCGNIGSIVADRAQGLHMKVVAFDPYLTEERAVELGVEKVTLDTLLSRADFITLHTPLTDQTRNILSGEALSKTKRGVRIINCARGGLIDERALAEALDAGQVAGAALDVFETEPATDNILFGRDDVVCTPHLGAATTEAQENVAVQIAEQIADYLLSGAVTNALNMASVSAEEAPKLRPFITLAERLRRSPRSPRRRLPSVGRRLRRFASHAAGREHGQRAERRAEARRADHPDQDRPLAQFRLDDHPVDPHGEGNAGGDRRPVRRRAARRAHRRGAPRSQLLRAHALCRQ